MPSRAWVVTVKHSDLEGENMFQCPHGLELLRYTRNQNSNNKSVNALMGLSCYNDSNIDNDEWNVCQCPHGLELLRDKDWREKRTQTVSMPSWAWVVTQRKHHVPELERSFNALMGLSCYLYGPALHADMPLRFNALMGLSCYAIAPRSGRTATGFNALMGLSCYGKNVQYFKFFMILFMHPCYL